MRYISTRGSEKPQTLSFAMNQGLANDGGLFIPEKMPTIAVSNFSSELSYPEFCAKLLEIFFAGDVLEGSLPSFCERAFDFPVPVKQLDKNSFVLELFHGPTSSFKDFGAKFLSECLNALASQMKTIMVATSGDTGSAVANAFYKKSNYRAVILYPEGKISKKQEHQITCWDQNVFAFAVKGTFDDCQKLVKDAFNNPLWQAGGGLSSANSINIGRLLPQITYYAYTSLQLYRQHNLKPGFIIPTGNLGNATAAYWAKAMGFPIRDIVLATNANRVILDYLQTHHYQPRRSIETIANAMDVGNPSNFERLQHLLGTVKNFEKEVHAISVDDDKIRETIKETYQNYHYISCPHTATALFARKQLDDQLWVSVATADPCKFDDVIEPILNIKVPVAPQLQKLLDKPTRVFQVEANLDKIHEKLLTL